MNQGVLSENHSPAHPIDRSTITPRPYQVEALEATLQAYAQGQRRMLIALPTGTGKTIIFALLLKERGGRAPGVALVPSVRRRELTTM